MEFKKGDKVIINGEYSGIIIRATPERDMYVVRYRHRSENKLVNIMYRGGELDLMSPPRPNPLPPKPEIFWGMTMSVEEKWDWIDAAGEYVEAYLDKIVPQIDADDWEAGDLGFSVEQSGLSASKYYQIDDFRSDTQFKIRISDHAVPNSAADHGPPDYDLRPGENVDLLIAKVDSYLSEISKARSRSNPLMAQRYKKHLEKITSTQKRPSCYPDDGIHSAPMADFRGWRIAVSFLGESGIKYVDLKTKSYTSVPRFTAPPITDWLEVIAGLDELENDPQISVLADSLEVEELADAPDVFLEGWYDPIFFQSYKDDGKKITNRSEWDLIGFLGPHPDGNVPRLHQSMLDYRFKTILSFDKQEYGSFVIGDKISVLKSIAGEKMAGGGQRLGRHAFDIAAKEGSQRNWNYFTSEEDLQEHAQNYYLPHTLFQRNFSKCFLGYFRGAEMAGNFGQASDHPMNNPFNTMSFSYLDFLGGYSSIYARMEKNIDEICNSMSKSEEGDPSLDRHLPSLPADDPDYQQSAASKLIDDALAESIKKSYWDDYFGSSDSPLPRGRTDADVLADLRGENHWLAPYIERSKKKKNPSPLSPSQLSQDDVIIEEMPSETNPHFSVLFQSSPLKYKKYGPSASIFRIALCDDRVEDPPSKRDMYFGEYEEWRHHTKKSYKRLKKPVLEEIIPGVGNDCIIAFLDYTTRGDNGFYIDYMKVRNGYSGQGVARALIEAFYSEVLQDGDHVNWGRMMNEKVEHLMESMQEKYPNISSDGGRNF